MEALEAAKAKLKDAQAKLAETQKRVNEELKNLDERAEGVKKRLEDLTAERATLAAPIDPDALDLYTRIFIKKGDAAIVPMENAQCGGCHMKVVVGVIQSLKQSVSLTQCEAAAAFSIMVE
jgi:predicted  nucleic acid-binding Zn-ribbon protein